MVARVLEQGAGWLYRQLQKQAPKSAHNFYLEGPYAPVSEERSETALRVRGEIPPELDGLYARIGPNPIHVPNPGAHHWFLGDGMVHGVRLGDGRAHWYRNRWVGTDQAHRQLGRPLVPGPRRSLIDTVNTNVFAHAGEIWATVEAGPLPVALDGGLTTRRYGFFNSDTRYPFTAHPKRDPMTGELHAICYDGMDRGRVWYLVIDAEGELSRALPIKVKHGPMIHDCAITERYIVVLDLPVTFSWRAMLRGAGLPYAWNPRHGARVGLIRRDGSDDTVAWHAVDPCYVFHTCNAFDNADTGEVVVDVVTHARMFDRSRQGPEAQEVAFERWRLGGDKEQVARQVLSERPQEFPRFDERRTGHAYRYAYTVGGEAEKNRQVPLLCHDLHTGRTQQHDYGPHHMTDEAVFVPRHADAAEDDGWLISYVHDLHEGSSQLVILNAADFEAEPQAVVQLPARVPLGFHGNWIPSTSFAA